MTKFKFKNSRIFLIRLLTIFNLFFVITIAHAEDNKDEINSEPSIKKESMSLKEADSIVKKNQPAWILSLPKNSKYVYSIGESRDISNKDDALERAWISGLLRIGMTQFPELGSLKSESYETLHDASYTRNFVIELEKIKWDGLHEMEDMGSPYVEYNKEKDTYTVYRLLRWAKSELENSKKKIKQKVKNEIPVSPEIKRKNEEELISEVKSIQEVNKKIKNRDAFIGSVLKKVTCGVTIDDLVRILGSPDREGAYNQSSLELEYYWGTFKVTHWSKEKVLYSITNKNGGGNSRYLCSNY